MDFALLVIEYNEKYSVIYRCVPLLALRAR